MDSFCSLSSPLSGQKGMQICYETPVQMSYMFDTKRLTAPRETQTSQYFAGWCECLQISEMEHQNPTLSLSQTGSSILTACDQESITPSNLITLSAAGNEGVFKREHSHHFATDLQHARNNGTVYRQSVDEDYQEYGTARDIQPQYHETSPLHYFQCPTYLRNPSYLNYPNQPLGALSTASTVPESPAINQFSSTYFWSTQNESLALFDSSRDEIHYTTSPEEERDDVLSDKPYARLIYDALMQAPGHRMMLREIYDWFQRHTTKPVESGTNGWQNSIRHNLSMNQAFENDKSDLASAAGQRPKVNSVWVLTENAIKNGVQSTTRYRKTGSGKKMNNNRIPAPLRQRSGAKGGKAARRAAQLRKKEYLYHQHCQASTPLHFAQTPRYECEGSTYDGAESSDALSALDPATPMPGFPFGDDLDRQPLRYMSQGANSFWRQPSESTCIADPDQSLHDIGSQSASDLALEEMLKLQQDLNVSNLPT